MKPTVSPIFVTWLALGFAPIAQADWQVWTVTETRHVLRSELPGGSTTVTVTAARNEWVSFQILLRSDAPVKGVSVEAGDLIGPGGDSCCARPTPDSTASTSFTWKWAPIEMTASNRTGIPTRSFRSGIR